MTQIEQNEEFLAALLDNWFISQLSEAELAILREKSTTVSYRKRESIVKKGEFATHLILVLKGFVKIEVEQGRKNFILDMVSKGNIIGLPVALSVYKQIYSVVPLTDATIQLIPIDSLRRIMEGNGRVALAAMEYANNHFVLPMLDKLQTISHNNIRGRLAKLILHLSQKTHCSNTFTLLLTRRELAQMIGFSRENVIRILTELNSEGVITIRGKHIEIVNPSRLEALARYS